MKFTSGIIVSTFPRMSSTVIALPFFMSLASRVHLSCMYPGHSNRKCTTVSELAPHVGHCAVSTLLILVRNLLSGMWVICSYMIRLADLHKMSVILIDWSRWAEGVQLSIFRMACPLSVFLHSFFQCMLVSSLCFCLIAEGLMVSECLRKRGSELLSDVKPSTAHLASLSTLLLPGMPLCLAVQWSTSGCLLHPGQFCRKVAC